MRLFLVLVLIFNFQLIFMAVPFICQIFINIFAELDVIIGHWRIWVFVDYLANTNFLLAKFQNILFLEDMRLFGEARDNEP